MKMTEGEQVERTMEKYEDPQLTHAQVQAILQTIERHVRSGPVGAFLRGLLLVTLEQGGGWYTRKQIGGAVGLEPDRCTGNVWVSTKLLFEQFDVHRNRLSEGLGGQLLALRHQDGNRTGGTRTQSWIASRTRVTTPAPSSARRNGGQRVCDRDPVYRRCRSYRVGVRQAALRTNLADVFAARPEEVRKPCRQTT